MDLQAFFRIGWARYIRRGVSRILLVLWGAYALWFAWWSYHAEGHITKEWIGWTLGRMIVPPLVVYLVVKIVEWVVAGFRAPRHPVLHQPTPSARAGGREVPGIWS